MSSQFLVFTPGSPTPPRGPVSREALVVEYRAGTLPIGSRACPVGGGEWLPIAEVLGVTTSEPMTAREVAVPPNPERFEVTTDGSTIIGPVSRDQLERGIDAERVPRDALARRVGEDGWRPVLLVLDEQQEEDKTTFLAAPVVPSPPKVATGQPSSGAGWRIPMVTFLVAVLGIGALGLVSRQGGSADKDTASRPSLGAVPTASISSAPASSAPVPISTVPTDRTVNSVEIPPAASSAPEEVVGLCVNMEAYFSELDSFVKGLSQVHPDFRAGNVAATDVLETARHWERMKKRTRASGEAVRRAEAAVQGLAPKEGEEKVRKELLSSYGAMAIGYEQYSAAFARGTKGIRDIAEVDEVVEQIPEAMKKRRRELIQMCKEAAGKKVAVKGAQTSPIWVTVRTQCHPVAVSIAQGPSGCLCHYNDGTDMPAPKPAGRTCGTNTRTEGDETCVWQCR